MARTTKQTLYYIWKEWILTLGIAFAVAFFFRTTIASPRHIPTGSMIPTIKIGEFIFVNMFKYDWHIPFTRKSFVKRADPEKGDVVVFEYPLDPDKDYIKRVIATPGDTVEVKDDRVILNGVPQEMTMVEDKSILDDLTPKYDPTTASLYREKTGSVFHYVMLLNMRRPMDFGPETVPENSFFVMGDNRDDSQDSRYWGYVPREKLLGKAGFTWFSFNSDHFPYLRFSRFFKMIH
ncbi:MAG: lepB [Bacteriovoracaceae bacterium]|nr:lepB [Bacteriovoracaceae bacterium]